jgi:hypothetical protein
LLTLSDNTQTALILKLLVLIALGGSAVAPLDEIATFCASDDSMEFSNAELSDDAKSHSRENLGRRGTGVFLVNVGLRNENRLILLYETAVVFG